MQLKETEILEELELINKQWKQIGDKYVNVSDNEDLKLYTLDERNKMVNESIDTFSAMAGNVVKELAIQVNKDYQTNTRVINNKSKATNKIKKDEIKFDVVIRDYKVVIKDMELTFNEKAVYRELCDMCFGKENMVCVDKEIPTLEQLSIAIGKNARTLTGYFQTLEKKGLIIREDFLHKKIIYINPMYYRTYLDYAKVSPHTLELFSCNNN